MSLCLRKLKKEAIKVELDKMTTNQITATDTEPTDCLSSFVAVLSPHCLDPKDLNTAIKPSHYPFPTMDDVTSRLTKAKVKLTENSSYWQISFVEDAFGISSVLWMVISLSKTFQTYPLYLSRCVVLKLKMLTPGLWWSCPEYQETCL